MHNDSDLMWQRLQTRLDQRFGKYFKSNEEQNEHKTSDGEPRQNVDAYKITFIASSLSEHIDD